MAPMTDKEAAILQLAREAPELGQVAVAERLRSEGLRISPSGVRYLWQKHGLETAVKRLHALGYRGDYSFEVFNDDYQQLPLETVAERARRSAVWLAEDVLKRAVPLPVSVSGSRRAFGTPLRPSNLLPSP